MTIATHRIEEILESGDVGEIICSAQENGKFVVQLSYNAAKVLAERYLMVGADTEEVSKAEIDWSTWPDIHGYFLRKGKEGTLPNLYQIMPKGLLLNFFRWNENDLQEAS